VSGEPGRDEAVSRGPAQAILSCTGSRTDGTLNAIPGQVLVTGDTRSFDPDVQDLLERRIREVSEGIGSAHGDTCTVTYTHEFAPTVNDPECSARAAAAAVQALGADRVDADCAPIMASEDFGIFAGQVPACFAFIGNGTTPGQGGTPLHSRAYDFNDDILIAGVRFYVQLVRDCLPSSSQPMGGAH
jgi:hippurate hydrolase